MAIKVNRLRVIIAIGTGTSFGAIGAVIGAAFAATIGGNPITGLVTGGALAFTLAAAFTWSVL